MYVIINGVSSDTIQGLQVLSLPPITKPKMRRQVDTIDGRDGDIITELGYEAYDRTITVLLHHNYDLDAITKFFNTSGEIIFSNEPDKKYYFQLLEKIDYERAVRFKTANITFHVQPYKYPVNETPLTVSTTAWEGTDYDQTPYIFRAVSDSSVEVGNRELIEQITGGTVAWNQLCKLSNINSNVFRGLNNSELIVVATTSTAQYLHAPALTNGHKYFFSFTGTVATLFVFYYDMQYGSKRQTYANNSWLYSASDLNGTDVIITQQKTQLTEGETLRIQIFDLTQMFGPTIADYIYSLEQSTAGAGVSLFKSLFPKDYYAYNAGELMSVKTSAHKTYDANDNVLGNYPISPIELRGIPKLVNNKIQYDGDGYKADGSVERRYGIVTVTGNENWVVSSDRFGANIATGCASKTGNIIAFSSFYPAVSANTLYANRTTANYMGLAVNDNALLIVDNVNYSSKDVTSFKTYLQGLNSAGNPLMVVYELASPTTETTTPYTETQICDADGTEEFIDDRDVQVPVGHKTKYMQVNDPAEIIVPNAGNVPSAPTIQMTGSGTVGVYLGNAQTLQVNIPEDGITIDTEAQDATSNGQLANRSVTGDYDSVRLQPGDNDVSFSGDVSAVITKYTRWV